MDEHVPRSVTAELLLRGVSVLTAQQDKRVGAGDDDAMLKRASELGRVLFSQDADLLRVGMRILTDQQTFSGIGYVHELRLTIGDIVADLDMIAKTTSLDDWRGRIEFLPI